MADGRHVGKYSKCHNSPTNGPTVTKLGCSHPITFPTCPPWSGCHGNGRCLPTASGCRKCEPISMKSHTRTVVRECCKGDNASQWRNPKFHPNHAQTPKATVIKVGRGDYAVDPYTYAKVRHDPPNGFRFRACVTLRTKSVYTRLVFFVFRFFGFLQLNSLKRCARTTVINSQN